jgi:hypothetical protein
MTSLTTHEVTAVIGVTGDIVGMVLVGLSKSTACAVASRMMGQEFTELDDLAQSGIGEIANIIHRPCRGLAGHQWLPIEHHSACTGCRRGQSQHAGHPTARYPARNGVRSDHDRSIAARGCHPGSHFPSMTPEGREYGAQCATWRLLEPVAWSVGGACLPGVLALREIGSDHRPLRRTSADRLAHREHRR